MAENVHDYFLRSAYTELSAPYTAHIYSTISVAKSQEVLTKYLDFWILCFVTYLPRQLEGKGETVSNPQLQSPKGVQNVILYNFLVPRKLNKTRHFV